MNTNDRRRHPRYEAVVNVTVYIGIDSFPGIMRDISINGIGIISKKKIEPGTKIFLILPLKGQYIIQGIVIWVSDIVNGYDSFYRMGIETHEIIHEGIKAVDFPEKSVLLNEMLFQIAEAGEEITPKTS